MRKLSVILLLGALFACTENRGPQGEPGPQGARGETGATGPQGAQGATGPIGGGLYTSRQDVYCKQQVGTRADAGFALVVECDDEGDLPLVGSCEGATDPNAMLRANRPSGWGDATSPLAKSAWVCGWSFASTGVTPAELPGATAHICCIKGR